jgi:hypothetical protein
MHSHGPSPALDFLAMIRAKERAPGGAAAFAILDDADRATLENLLRSYHDQGLTSPLERRVRTFLISYREMARHAGVLDAAERERLDQILDGPPDPPRRRAPQRRRGVPWAWVGAAFGVFLAAGLGVGLLGYVSSSGSGPAPVASAQPLPVQPEPAQILGGQEVPPTPTVLQGLRQDYGPWQQLTPSGPHPRTASPALLLLEDGFSYASERWTVAPGAPGWQPDLGGDVATVNVNGDQASLTDADGNSYVVGINQPFVISSHPETVLLIDRAGSVRYLSLAQATAVRHSLRK